MGAFLEINLCYIATDGLALTVRPSLKLSANLLHRPPELWNYWRLLPDPAGGSSPLMEGITFLKQNVLEISVIEEQIHLN